MLYPNNSTQNKQQLVSLTEWSNKESEIVAVLAAGHLSFVGPISCGQLKETCVDHVWAFYRGLHCTTIERNKPK